MAVPLRISFKGRFLVEDHYFHSMRSPRDFDENSLPEEGDTLFSLDYSRGGSVHLQPNRSPSPSPPPSKVFQMLANETRIQILLELYRAEHNEGTPIPFSALQSAIGSDNSARFAYHVRQLVDHFAEKEQDGYSLTPAGKHAASSILQGTFTNDPDGHQAS